MSQTGYTPIQLYHSTTAAAAPSAGNLANGELAVNITDGKLYYKDNGGVVQVLATKATGTIGGSTTQVQYNLSGALAGSANMTFNGTRLSVADFADASLTSGRVTYATTSGNLTDSANLTFDGTTLTANALTTTSTVTINGGTANGVAYLNGSKVLTTGSALTFDGTLLTNTGSAGGVRLAIVSTGSSPEVSITSADTGTSQINFGGATTPKKGVFRYSDNSDLFVWLLNSNAEQMRLTSTGLGIGTSSPASGGGGGLTLGTTASGKSLHVYSSSYANNGLANFYGTDGNMKLQMGALSATSAYIFANTGCSLALYSGGNLNATLDASGNLGLGVTPSAWGSFIPRAIELPNGVGFASQSNASVAHFSANAYYDGSWRYKANSVAARYALGPDTHAWYTAPSGTAGDPITFTQAMTLDASGNLGIGTSSPGARLHVAGEQLIQPATAANAKLSMRHGSIAANNYFEVDISSNTIFGTNNAERARITSGGDLLVGTAAAAYASGERFSISPASGSNAIGIAIGNTNNIGIGIYNGYTATGTATALQFQDHNAVVRGSITVTTSATAYNTSSDYRLKHDIAPMTGALAKVAALKPCTYKWNVDNSAGEGFIAHELAEVCPAAVTGEKDAVDAEGKPVYQGIDTSFLVATLAAAIKELKAEFDAYKATHP